MNALPVVPNWNRAREDTSSSDLAVPPTRGVPSVSFQRASVSPVSDSSDAGRSPAVNTASGMAPATNGASVATWATTAWYGFLACAALILAAKAMGAWLKRQDRYYEEPDDDR